MTKKIQTLDELSPEVGTALELIRRQIDKGTTEDHVLVLSEIVDEKQNSLSQTPSDKAPDKTKIKGGSRFLTYSDLYVYLEERLPKLVADLVRRELTKKKDL